VERKTDMVHDGVDEIDHARGAAGQRGTISRQANAASDNAIETAERKFRVVRQSRARGRVGHKTDSRNAFGATQHFDQRGRDMMTVRDQLASDLWLAERKLEQAGLAINSVAARARHAIERVRDAAHATLKSSARLFIPGVAVATAHIYAAGRESFDRRERARQFRRNRDSPDKIDMFEERFHCLRRRIANEFCALRAALRFRNERPFNMNARNLFNGRSIITNRAQDMKNVLERCDRSCKQQRRCAAARVIIADRMKRFGRSLHRIAAECAVQVKIDKAGGEIISIKIDNSFCTPIRPLPNCGDPSLLRFNFEAIADSIRKDQACIGEDHLSEHNCV